MIQRHPSALTADPESPSSSSPPPSRIKITIKPCAFKRSFFLFFFFFWMYFKVEENEKLLSLFPPSIRSSRPTPLSSKSFTIYCIDTVRMYVYIWICQSHVVWWVSRTFVNLPLRDLVFARVLFYLTQREKCRAAGWEIEEVSYDADDGDAGLCGVKLLFFFFCQRYNTPSFARPKSRGLAAASHPAKHRPYSTVMASNDAGSCERRWQELRNRRQEVGRTKKRVGEAVSLERKESLPIYDWQ